METEVKGIKETLEVLEGIKAVVVPVKAALKDGFQPADLSAAIALLDQYKVILAAVDGAADVIGEAKDLDSVEAAVIVAKLFDVIKSIKAA